MQALRHHAPLALILLVALIWRLILWAQPLHLPANDEVEYLTVVRDLLGGRGWVFYESWPWLRAPLYPLFLAGSLWLADGNVHLAALPNVALSVAVVWLIYLLARELAPEGSRRPALLAAAIAALLQTYATFASLYMSETLFTFFFTGSWLALARWRRKGGLWRVALAGALLGLACLTRSAGLAFLPVAMAWIMGLDLWRRRRLRVSAVAPALVMAVVTVLVIAPWTIRNCFAYGECVLIETGSARDLWVYYEPRETIPEIHAQLKAIPSPAERADFATQRGLERLREDPIIFLRKIPTEWIRLWSVKPIEDRFLLPDYNSDPPPLIFLASLLLDDLLYFVVMCAAPFGIALALTRREGLAWPMLFWLLIFLAATMVTHAEWRYRHFLFMVLIPLAALALDGFWRGERLRLPTLALVALPLSLMVLAFVAYYPWAWAWQGAQRSVYRQTGDWHAAAGRDEAAVEMYLAALRASPTPDGWFVLGDLHRRKGDLAATERYYQLARENRPGYVGASVVMGDFLREQGRADEARVAFQGQFLEEQRTLDWGFQMLKPAPYSAMDIGSGLDIGYVGGVYPAEMQQGSQARWTNGRARLRLDPLDAEAGLVRLTLRAAAPHPDGLPVPLTICAQRQCETVTLAPAWRTFHLLLPAPNEPIDLRSPTFYAPDRRDLGVLLDHAAVRGLALP
ncbi:glycosyltransferase family 39 protein [Candidatus Chloroploca sp. M-50]|uniref:Glycosyltransferase family 39 protein n=1 Tax=Candidatus Chloroploca mongolica TaxID=2528176 RepID=A0ABS4DGK2_9CHLR|nr:tetratricopeptide repeat protein [Candidatus Chloroploca mongolica]MBP1468574.1 glycosyltransferase family 39 protein [Candidatus Chloroploca mongolica]